jgi:hypothetical protein
MPELLELRNSISKNLIPSKTPRSSVVHSVSKMDTAQTLVDIRPPISLANWAGDKRQNNLFGDIEVIISGGKCSHVGSRRL